MRGAGARHAVHNPYGKDRETTTPMQLKNPTREIGKRRGGLATGNALLSNMMPKVTETSVRLQERKLMKKGTLKADRFRVGARRAPPTRREALARPRTEAVMLAIVGQRMEREDPVKV
jgi:hypothetical protein